MFHGEDGSDGDGEMNQCFMEKTEVMEMGK